MVLELWEDQIIKSLYLWLGSMFILVGTLFYPSGTSSAKSTSADSLVSLSHIRQKVLADSVAGLMGRTITVATGVFHERYLQVFIQSDSVGISLFKNTVINL